VGYSSLGYLARFPVDCLKIDRSFVSDLSTNRHEAIVTRGIISMARGLNLTTVAEGVETDAQLEFLRDNRCDQVQGYLLSHPISAGEITRQFLDAAVTQSPDAQSSPGSPLRDSAAELPLGVTN
jgi:EAL domain-containing protein (putative c-di-GMP-specific phosphodiesterase class I)